MDKASSDGYNSSNMGFIKDFSGAVLTSAIEANLWELGTHLGKSPKVELNQEAGMQWYATGIKHPAFNGVFRTQIVNSEIRKEIERALGFFRSRRLPLSWWIGPSSRPPDLGKLLRDKGLTPGPEMLGMATDLTSIEQYQVWPAQLRIKEVDDLETLKRWTQPFAVAFGVPVSLADAICDLFAGLGLTSALPLRHFVGYLHETPIACCSLFLGAGVAGIYNVATSPAQRGKGIGATLTINALLEARKLSYQTGILHASTSNSGMYQRIGFKEYCRISTYIIAPKSRLS
ncbi:MAG: GNAT family N-acetyltransferase [Chloroflexi bacterium]|nr:GNAT family N-acetyltransferase [Chloroflexota bacterium]